MTSYIKELNEYLANLIKEYSNEYLDNFDIFESNDTYKRLNILQYDTKIITNINSITKKIYKIEKYNNLYDNVKYNEFICYAMVLFKDLNIKNNVDLYKRYGFALRSLFIKSNNIHNDLILF